MKLKRLCIKGMVTALVAATMPINALAAPSDNNVAPSAIYGAKINMSLDQKSVKYAPQYFDPNKLYSSRGTYELVGIPGLSTAQMDVAREIISGLQDLNLSQAMLAGILGNIMQECSFEPTCTTGSHYGLVQWDTTRTKGLKTLPDYETAKTQTEYIKAELQGTAPATENYGKKVDEYLKKYDNSDMQTVEDVEMACEAFCAKVEGCTGGNDLAKDGEKYQELNIRKEFAVKFYDYIQKTSSASGRVGELLAVANSLLGREYVWGAKGPNTFDCSGFVYWCLNQIGFKYEYRATASMVNMNDERMVKITNFNDLQPGDIVVARYIGKKGDEVGHTGIVAENGQIFHASQGQGKVIESALSNWWSERFKCGWRIIEFSTSD